MAYGIIRPALTVITRPNDVLGYLAGDVWAPATASPSALVTFANASGTAGVSNFRLIALDMSVLGAAVAAQFRMEFFSGVPTNATRVGDNVPWPILDADKAIYLKWVNFPPTMNGMAGSDSSAAGKRDALSFPVTSEAGTGNVYGILRIMTAITPTALQTLQVQGVFENYVL